jgi:uncharacterized cupin superfamily protein
MYYAWIQYNLLITLEGNAVLVPKNAGESYENIPVSKGDYCIFKKGFLCEWQIVQRIRKRYCFFDEKGEMVVGKFGIKNME